MLRLRGGYTASSPRTLNFVRVNNSRATRTKTSATTSTRCATATATSTVLSTATNVSQVSRGKRGPVIQKNCPNKADGCRWRGPEDEVQGHIDFECLYVPAWCDVCKQNLFRGNILGHRSSCPHSRVGCNWEGLCREEMPGHLNSSFSREDWLKGCRFVLLKCIHCGEDHMRGKLMEKLEKKLPGPNSALSWIYAATHQEASDKWFDIGLDLNVPYGTLKRIKHDYRDQCDNCYREMLSTWLNLARPTAGDLVNTLRKSSIGKGALAQDFEKAVVCDDAERTKRQSKIEEAERIMAQATEQCQTMERLQKALRAINRKLEINKYYLKDHKKQLNKHRSELQAAKGGDPKFFDYTQQKIEEIEGTVQASVDSIETLNDQIKEEERQRRELIQQILQCKNDIEDMNCKLTTLKNELRRNMQQLEREKNLLIEKIPVILQDLDDAAARAGTAIGVLGGVAGFVGGSAALAFGGPLTAVAGLTYLGYKHYNHPGEKEKRRVRAEYMELTRRCTMTARNIEQTITKCQSNLNNMEDLVYEE